MEGKPARRSESSEVDAAISGDSSKGSLRGPAGAVFALIALLGVIAPLGLTLQHTSLHRELARVELETCHEYLSRTPARTSSAVSVRVFEQTAPPHVSNADLVLSRCLGGI